MDFKCCPVCGNSHISDNLCKDCDFDCSTDAEHYQTLMIIEGWKSAHAYNKKAWTNSWDFWKNIKIARSSIQTITFQKGFEGCMEDADELIDSERNLFRVWCVDNHMYIGADRPIVFPEDISYLFSILKNLSSIEFDNINTSKVTDMRYLFAGCSKLTELDLSCFDTSHVTNMSDMFYGCGRLETLNIHSLDTTNVTDMSNMFYGCGRLTKLDLSAFDISNVTSLNNMFYGCCKLTGLDLFSYDSSNERNIEDMFYGCASLPQGKYFLPVLDQYSLRSVDSRHADQQVRGAVVLPNGTGKTRRVLVFAKDAKVEEAKAAGADYVGGMDLFEKITKENWFEFDVVVASPDMMGIVGRLAKVLGPKGLMPSPKAGTLTPNVAAAVKEIKAGKVEYRLDKTNIIHCPIGKVSFGAEKPLYPMPIESFFGD